MDRRAAFARHTPLPEECGGAALFADISGFTELLDSLSEEHGPGKGAEEVSRTINTVFSTLIDALHRYRGSVLHFSGDAITCWIDETGPGQNQAAGKRAISAGLAMCEALEELRESADKDHPLAQLKLSVALTQGQARRFLVGNPQLLRLDVVTGAPMQRIAIAEMLAQPGDFVVGPEVMAQHSADLIIGKTHRDGYCTILGTRAPATESPWPEFPGVPNDQGVTFVRSEIREHVTLDAPTLGDLRKVSPLFCTIEGIDYNSDPLAGEILDSVVRFAQECAQQCGGAVHELSVGEKSTYLYLVFGAPISNTDDCSRSLQAAALLRDSPLLSKLGIKTKIGLSRGRVFTGICGSRARSCYAVLGDEVNVAARLMAHASEGQVLVTQTVRDESEELHPLKERVSLTLKGKNQPIRVFNLQAELRAMAKVPPKLSLNNSDMLVGRDKELALLFAHLDDALVTKGSLVIIEGEPGIGKSMLLAQLIQRAETFSFNTVVAHASSNSSGIALRAWRKAIATQLGLITDLGQSTQLAGLAGPALEAIAPGLSERLPLLNAIFPTAIPDNDLTRWMSQEVRGDNTNKLLMQILSSNAHFPNGTVRPTLIVLDDAHCADTSSWGLLEHCSQVFPHALIVIAARPLDQYANQSLIPETYKSRLQTGTTRLALSSLSATHGESIIASTLACTSVPSELVDFINSRAAGHPFYTVELSLALQEAGLIEVKNGDCSITTNLSDLQFPDSIEGVITGRIDRLPAFDQQVLKSASVIGLAFKTSPLQFLVSPDSDKQNIAPALNRIESRELVKEQAKTLDGRSYSFQHSLTQEVGYQLLHHAQRRTLHADLARYYETRHHENLGPWRAILAHHWELAENSAKAILNWDIAGQGALQQGAFRECLHFYSKANGLGTSRGQSKQQALWQSRISSAHYRLGELAEAREAAEKALIDLDIPVPSGARLATSIAREVFRQTRHRISPKKFIGKAEVQKRPDLRASVRLYMNLSELYYLAGEPGPSIYAAVRLVNVGEMAGESSELLEAYGVASIICGLIGRHAWSESYADLAWKLADRLNTPVSDAIVRHQLSLYQAAMGNFDKVRDYETKAASIYEHLGDVGRLRDALGLHGTTEYLASNYNCAHKLLTELVASRRGDESFVQNIWGAGWLGAIALRRGNYVEAKEWLEKSLALLDSNTAGLMEVSILGMLAEVCKRVGDQARSQELALQTLERIEKSKGRPSGHISLDGYVSAALLYHQWSIDTYTFSEKERELHTARAKKMAGHLRAFAKIFPIGEPAALLFSGLRKQAEGRDRSAAKLWNKGRRSAETLNMRYELGQLDLAMGTLSSTPAEQRQKALLSSLTLFEDIGAKLMVSQVEAHLNELAKL